jgi:hypothetical protein
MCYKDLIIGAVQGRKSMLYVTPAFLAGRGDKPDPHPPARQQRAEAKALTVQNKVNRSRFRSLGRAKYCMEIKAYIFAITNICNKAGGH